MNRPFQRLLLATLLGGLTLAGAAQEPSGSKKSDPKAAESGKAKDGKPLPDKTKLPPGALLIVPKAFENGLPIWPAFAVMPLEDYLKLKDAAEKRPAKAEKTLAHSCELTGRLEGDYVTLRGEFTFATQEPRTTVYLGLQEAQLTEKGDLDGQPPVLGGYTEDDGFSVRVDEPGNHRLVLHLRVPVKSKRPAGLPRVERTLVLGLPQTVITTLTLELPAAVKDVLWNNEVLEKNRVQGKWFFALGRKQSLTLLWREPIAQPGGGPHLGVEGKVTVNLRGADAEVSAELLLEDPHGQTKECQLLLPPQADVKVEPPAGVPYELIGPSPKNPYHLLRFREPNAEQWKVTVFVKLPRPTPGGRLSVGPFLVVGAEKQRGTIAIKLPPDAPRTQRLIYHRQGDVFQRDAPKGTEALFEYWVPNASRLKAPGAARVPLELEIRSERGPLEGAVDQVLKLRPSGDGWEIDLTARLVVKAPYASADFIDVLLPRPRPIGAATFAVHAAAGFPAALPWPALELVRGRRLLPWALPQEFQIGDEGGMIDVPPPDAQGRCRVPLPRAVGKGYTLTLTGKYAVASESQRVRVGLPRVLGIAEQGSKVAVQADESVELLDGAPGQEQPVQEKHRYQFAVDETPGFVDVAWRPYRPDFPANALIDVMIHGRTAQVRQRLVVGPPPRPGPSQPSRLGQIELQVPAGVKGLALLQGGERIELRPERGIVSVTPRGEAQREVILEYDLRLSERPAANEKDGPRTLEVQAIWPKRATHLQAKVRVWCEPGSRVQMVAGELWRDRGVEPVKERELLPALVVEGDGPELPLRLVLDETAGGGIAALVCERALIEVVGEDDGLSCRARYVVGKVNADAVDVEFPVRLGLCEPKVHLGEHGIAWKPVDGNDKAIRIPLQALAGTRPIVLEIVYRLPRSTQDGWVFGIATLAPPIFRDPVRVTRLRWQLNLPAADVLAVPITPGARMDFRLGLFRCVLAPEPVLSSADLDAWLLGTGAAGDARPTGLSFWPAHPTDAQRVFHQTRLAWLIVVSGLAVLLFLVIYFLRLARAGLVVVVGLLALGVLALALALPALLAPLLFGAQPGLAVIGLMLLMFWLRQERYRRQLVFIPGFTRLKAGSSLVRNGKSSKRPRETSTIDAPTPAGVAGPGPSSSAKK